MKRITILLFVTFLSLNAVSQERIYSNEKDKEIFQKYIKEVGAGKYQSFNDLIIATAKFFLETPYVGHTLEIEPEGLVVNLRELDCTTFVETVLALSRTVRDGNATFENFMGNLKNIRYRNGVINDYSDRLHYTTDWIFENERKGLVKNITKDASGKDLDLNLYIMSSNPDRYKQLKGKEVLTSKIKEIEKRATARKNWFIPNTEIEKNGSAYKSGDIVAFVTTIKGIDISHVAFIYKENGRLTFIHASSSEKRVVIEKHTLEEYAQNSKTNIGIMVARPL